METLFVIGNGFDLNLGMHTKYTDFFTYYEAKSSPHPLIEELKKSIAIDKPNWADFELAFGEFTKKIGTIEEFDQIFEDVGFHLSEYLEYQESIVDLSTVKRDNISKYLCHPEKSLLQADADLVSGFKRSWNNHQWNIQIVTLNYTRTLDRIFWEHDKDTKIGNHNGIPIILNGIHHVHGYTDIRMILGVNDVSQIGNKDFHENTDILEALVKTRCNIAQKHNVDAKCAKLISRANLICIFGSSLGDTDNHWWELIGEQLKRNARIIIFTKGEEVILRTGYKIGRIERAIRERFINKTKLTDSEKKQYSPNIYVGFNTGMFS